MLILAPGFICLDNPHQSDTLHYLIVLILQHKV